MDFSNFLLQLLNSVQYGLLLFMLAAGLTLIFGIMGVVNLAHGSFYMLGAYLAWSLSSLFGSLTLAILLGSVLAVAFGLPLDWSGQLALEHRLAQILVERGADAGEDPSPHHVEQALEEVEHDDDDAEPDQGWNAPTGQDPVVHLHHEDRARQIEQVDQTAQHRHAEEGAAA